MIRAEARSHPLRLHANHVSIGESGDEYFQVSFDSKAPSDDDFDRSGRDHPYLVVQRQFEDDDGGVCYIETPDRNTYYGFRRFDRTYGEYCAPRQQDAENRPRR